MLLGYLGRRLVRPGGARLSCAPLGASSPAARASAASGSAARGPGERRGSENDDGGGAGRGSRSRTNRESRLHARFLSDLFDRHGALAARSDALEYFSELVESGRARTMHFNAMLRFCATSDDMRRVIDEDMRAVRVRPDVATFNALAMQLRLEGDEDAAWRVLDDMVGPEWGMHWNLDTWKIATVSVLDLQAARLQRLAEQHQECEDKQDAERGFRGTLNKGLRLTITGTGTSSEQFYEKLVQFGAVSGAYEDIVEQGAALKESAHAAGGALPAGVDATLLSLRDHRLEEQAPEAEYAPIKAERFIDTDLDYVIPAETPTEPQIDDGKLSPPRPGRTHKIDKDVDDALNDPFHRLSLPPFDDLHYAEGKAKLRGDRAAEQAWVEACVAAHTDRIELIEKLETISGVRARIGSPTALSWRLLSACYARRRAVILSRRLGSFYRRKKRSLKGAPGKQKRLRKTMAADIGTSERILRYLLRGEWSAHASEAETALKIVRYLESMEIVEKAGKEEEKKRRRLKQKRKTNAKKMSTKRRVVLDPRQLEEEEFVPSNMSNI